MPKALVEFLKVEEIDGTQVGINPKHIKYIRPSGTTGCTTLFFIDGDEVSIRVPFEEAITGLMGLDEEEETWPTKSRGSSRTGR